MWKLTFNTHLFLVLLLMGFAVPFLLPKKRYALTIPFHPYHKIHGGLFSVALSLELPLADVIRHHVPKEPGLSSQNVSSHQTIWQVYN